MAFRIAAFSKESGAVRLGDRERQGRDVEDLSQSGQPHCRAHEILGGVRERQIDNADLEIRKHQDGVIGRKLWIDDLRLLGGCGWLSPPFADHFVSPPR